MSENRLYTIILDYNGGTYIGQAPEESVAAALQQLLAKIADEELSAWGLRREVLTKIATTDDAIAVLGCVNVSCLSGSAEKGLVLINVVVTDQS
jgi:hypothetical protein